MFVLVLMAAMASAWVYSARQQQAAVAALRKSNPGAAVSYVAPEHGAEASPRNYSLWRSWLASALGDDYSAPVLYVSLDYPTDADLECVAQLPRLQVLLLERSVDMTDRGLARLTRLRDLQRLVITDAEQLTDAGVLQLRALTRLTYLRVDLGRRRLSAETIDALRRALPKCRIEGIVHNEHAAANSFVDQARRAWHCQRRAFAGASGWCRTKNCRAGG